MSKEIQFGNVKTTFPLGSNGSSLATLKKYRKGEVEKALRHYRLRVKVTSSQDEMTEFMRFTDELSGYRKNGTLTFDRDDGATRPAFIIEYPREDIDGSWFVIKNFCLIDIH